MSWYIMFTQTGYEDDICAFINKVADYIFPGIDYNLLVPKRKLFERHQGITHEVIRKIFPGYILVETDNILGFYCRIKGLPRIYNVLRNYDYFYEVRHEDISQILYLIDENGLIDISEGFVIDEQIQVVGGPLYGWTGFIKKIDKRKGRAKVLFEVGDNEHLIDLGINVLQRYEAYE